MYMWCVIHQICGASLDQAAASAFGVRADGVSRPHVPHAVLHARQDTGTYSRTHTPTHIRTHTHARAEVSVRMLLAPCCASLLCVDVFICILALQDELPIEIQNIMIHTGGGLQALWQYYNQDSVSPRFLDNSDPSYN